MEIEKKFILSPTSGLTFYKECERCWWLTKNTDWKRPTYGFPTLPGGIDKILKKYYDEFRTQNLLPPEISTHPKYKTLKPFYNQTKLTEYRRSRWRKAKIEEQGLVYKDENLRSILHGGIDELLETADGKLVVLDYKIRALPPNTKII